MEDIEGQESGVETSVDPESQSAAPESSQPEPTAQAAAAPKPDETPFHEHPRFKELVEQKNKALESTRALELKLAQLEGRLQSAPSPQAQAAKDELIEDIRKIDPRLAKELEEGKQARQELKEFKEWRANFEKTQAQQSQQQVVQQSVAKINTWHEANKVPDPIKNAINAQLDVMYMQGKLNQQNLEQAYKAAYEPYKAFIEQTQREALKSYVPAKKADANTPTSQPKGTPASKPAKAPEKQFKDREELRAHVAKEFVKSQQAKREASSV